MDIHRLANVSVEEMLSVLPPSSDTVWNKCRFRKFHNPNTKCIPIFWPREPWNLGEHMDVYTFPEFDCLKPTIDEFINKIHTLFPDTTITAAVFVILPPGAHIPRHVDNG
jgi:hypothetical protein